MVPSAAVLAPGGGVTSALVDTSLCCSFRIKVIMRYMLVDLPSRSQPSQASSSHARDLQRSGTVVFLSTATVGLILCARLCLFCLRDRGRGCFHNGCVIGAQPGVRRRVGAQ